MVRIVRRGGASLPNPRAVSTVSPLTVQVTDRPAKRSMPSVVIGHSCGLKFGRVVSHLSWLRIVSVLMTSCRFAEFASSLMSGKTSQPMSSPSGPRSVALKPCSTAGIGPALFSSTKACDTRVGRPAQRAGAGKRHHPGGSLCYML